MVDQASALGDAERWLLEDPDPSTVAELRSLIERTRGGDAEAARELADAFDGTLHFGTAGLRGRLGPGSNRMNRVVVARAAAGLAAYLRDRGGHSIVIGYDARLNSDVFAHDTARIMAGAGIAAMVLPHALPTPVTAFAIHFLGTDAAVMVTASHNPPEDNGYKVYLGDGAQIVSPTDDEISTRIEQVGSVAAIARSDDYVTLDSGVLDAYIERAVALLPPGPRELVTVYTAMHGVGGEVMMRAVAAAGFQAPQPVVEQFEPDGRFPTVKFPNPEEPGAMDLALAVARAHGADLIVAHDPDADRFAAGVPALDGFRMLSGDEVGALLAWWIITRMRRLEQPVVGTMAQSLVSCSVLRSIAEAAGLQYAVTLTGFKWLSRVPQLIFGYEEALGYCVDPRYVTDKDGITAALLMMELAAFLKAEGRGVQDVLDDLAEQFGLHLTAQVSVRVTDLAVIADTMATLRANPPSMVGERPVIEFIDLERGAFGLPPSDGLLLTFDGGRVVIRPSGTEPKLKCYLQCVVSVDGDVSAARAIGEAEMVALRAGVSEILKLTSDG